MAEGKFCILLRCIQEKNRHLTSFSAVMEHSATNLKAAVFACVVILSTALPIKCGPSQYTVFHPQNEEKIVMCQDCPTCPRGEGVPVQCGSRVPNGTSTQCKPCEHGKTYSNTVDSSTCLSCNECGKKTVLQQCNLFENRKCGDCLEKHFLEPHLNDCVECFTCCSDVPDNERMDQCGKVGLPKSEWCEANEKNKLCAIKLNATKSNKENETLSSTSLTGVDKTLASTTSSLFESSGSNYSTISRNPTDLVNEVEISVKRDPVQIGIATSFSVLLALLVVGFIMYKRWFATRTHSSNRDVRYVGVETENHQQQMTNMKIENIPEDLVISDIEKLHCRTDDNNDVMIFHIQKKLDIPETHERKTWRSVGLALKMDPDILDGILSKELTTLSALEHFKTLGNQQPKLREFVRALIGCERKDLASIICNWPYENN